MFFQPLAALSTVVLCLGELVAEVGSIDSQVGGVVGGVIGFANDPGDEVPESSTIIIKLSPLPEPQEPGPVPAECLFHPKFALKGDADLC